MLTLAADIQHIEAAFESTEKKQFPFRFNHFHPELITIFLRSVSLPPTNQSIALCFAELFSLLQHERHHYTMAITC